MNPVESPADSKVWADYNAAQADRPVRSLCLDAMALAGPGTGRPAIDLGCGAGKETLALLSAGWNVHAVDSLPDTRERLQAIAPAAGRAGSASRCGRSRTSGTSRRRISFSPAIRCPSSTRSVSAAFWADAAGFPPAPGRCRREPVRGPGLLGGHPRMELPHRSPGAAALRRAGNPGSSRSTTPTASPSADPNTGTSTT